MADYYQLPPKRNKHSYRWIVLLLLLLFLLGIVATLWSLRLRPGEIGEDPLLGAAALPAEPVAAPEAPITEIAAEPIPLTQPAGDPPEEEAAVPVEAARELPPPPLFSDARWREAARFTGTDEMGRSAEFTVYVLVGDETWAFARADSIFAAGLSEPVETAFSKLELGTGICDLSRVIAIGAASVEGTAAQNTFLSRARGAALGNAIAANLPCGEAALPVSVLDLGYSRQAIACPSGEPICPDLTAPQRPIAMILADAEDPETNIGQALRSGIEELEASGGEVLPGVRVSEYSGFLSAFNLL